MSWVLIYVLGFFATALKEKYAQVRLGHFHRCLMWNQHLYPVVVRLRSTIGLYKLSWPQLNFRIDRLQSWESWKKNPKTSPPFPLRSGLHNSVYGSRIFCVGSFGSVWGWLGWIPLIWFAKIKDLTPSIWPQFCWSKLRVSLTMIINGLDRMLGTSYYLNYKI